MPIMKQAVFLFLLLLLPFVAVVQVQSFLISPLYNKNNNQNPTFHRQTQQQQQQQRHHQQQQRYHYHKAQKEETVQVIAQLDDERVTSLFAWVSRAFAGDERYSNLMLAIAAIFGNLPDESEPKKMARMALQKLPDEEEVVGDSLSLQDREYYSLGAMGAGQWTGQWKTRPHALLELKNISSVDDWVKTLPRGCRRTIKRSLQQNFTVTEKPIMGGQPAPHSSLAHFRCVIAHEVRLLSWGAAGFFDALAEGISRYIGTTRMTGEIQEYRNADGKIIAIAHEVSKGSTIRGQWFYCDDEASKSYVWFHSVYELVRRAIEMDGIDVVDLGPSGSDAFSELKAKYGFKSVDDWPAVANYHGDFYYGTNNNDDRGGGGSKRNWFDSLF